MKNKVNSAAPLQWGEEGAERSVDLDLYLANPSAYGRSNSRARVIAPGGTTRRRVERPRSKGQALLIIALMMTVLILFVGLGVDVGNLMGKRAKLQSAVDASALSAAQLLIDGVVTTTVQTKAYQILEANGILSPTLASKTVTVNTTLRQVQVQAVQHVDTFFMRIVPLWRVVDVSAEATADLNSYAELNIKPYGQPGVVNELMLQTWGPYSWRQGGDAYSPLYDPSVGPTFPNDLHPNQPYGYLFRIDVPAGFADDELAIQIFDADTYNRQDDMPTPTNTALPPTCSPLPCTPFPTAIPPTPNAYDSSYFWCAQSLASGCTSNDTSFDNPALRLDGYRTPVPWVQAPWTFGRTSIWRVDEYRQLNDDPGGIGPSFDEYDARWPTETNFTLWHFDPRINSAFADP
ncbi:MAG: pilus assembly protein TadG-related protein, partial [Chloroflexia bacterium]